jgi:hypothetical protein
VFERQRKIEPSRVGGVLEFERELERRCIEPLIGNARGPLGRASNSRTPPDP